jgi:hypothetical protein
MAQAYHPVGLIDYLVGDHQRRCREFPCIQPTAPQGRCYLAIDDGASEELGIKSFHLAMPLTYYLPEQLTP